MPILTLYITWKLLADTLSERVTKDLVLKEQKNCIHHIFCHLSSNGPCTLKDDDYCKWANMVINLQLNER